MKTLTAEEAYRRASGRRRYNAQRTTSVRLRRLLLSGELARQGWCVPDGWIDAQAERFEVSRHTIYRDLRALDVRGHFARREALTQRIIAVLARQDERWQKRFGGTSEA